MASVQTAACLVAAVIVLSGCAQTPNAPVDRRADDAVLMVPNVPAAAGKEAIRNALKQIVQDGNFSLKLENPNIEVARDGDLAWSHGTYSASFTDPAGSRQ